ncbi:MAG: 4'-phosphopantetheinyl transferase family protein [Flavobacteriales bacterium]
MYKNLSVLSHWNISNTDIYVLNLKELYDLETERINIEKTYKVELENIHAPKKRLEFISARIAHHFIFQHESKIGYLNCEPHFHEKYSLSISHCEDYIGLAYSSTHKIGIDLEKASSRIERIKYKILNEDEDAYYATLSNTEQFDYLNKIWTAKEACYKACNTNFFSFKKYFSHHILEENPTCYISETKENFNLYFKQIEKFYFCLAILSE